MHKTLGNYTLHEALGQGGFATVYRATHNTLHIPAAVKVLNEDYTQDERTRERFIREAQTASNLDHPHIVRILDLDEDQGGVFIAMEYLAGDDLRSWIKNHSLADRLEILRILGEAASALDYAHAQGMVHRDVKPSNILLDEQERVHLSDFGLVRPADAPHLTQIGSVVGTAAYLSPEQAESRPSIDGRADQYSLAIVAFELFTHQVPFSGDNSTAVAVMHVTKPPPPASSVDPAIPGEVDEVLLRALAKQPGERYATCQEFVRALEAAWKANDLRQFQLAINEARRLMAEGDTAGAHQRMLEARGLIGERPEQRDLLAALEAERRRIENYENGVREWKIAQEKAQAVLQEFPDYADPQELFPALGLRAPQRRRLTPPELRRQLRVGLLVGLPLAAAVLFGFFWWLAHY